MARRIDPRSKGIRGENEACKWLQGNLFHKFLERNLEQSRSGGADIIEPPFAFEVKRHKNYAFDKWWIQISVAVKKIKLEDGIDLIPIVMFRINERSWEFLIPAQVIGIQVGWIHIDRVRFLAWAKTYISQNVRGDLKTTS